MLAGSQRCLYSGQRMCLADSHQRDFVRVATNANRSTHNPFAHR